jgi:hypothetical protein
MLTPPGRLAPGRWHFRVRPPLRPGASQPTLWPHPSPKPQLRPPRAPPDIPRPLLVPSAVHRPSSAACRPPSIRRPRSVVHRPHSLFVPHLLTVCPPPNSIESPSSALHHPSSTVHVLPRPPPSAIYYPSPSPSSASSGRVPAASQARQYPRLKVWSRDVKAWGAGRAPGRAEASVPRQRPQPPS